MDVQWWTDREGIVCTGTEGRAQQERGGYARNRKCPGRWCLQFSVCHEETEARGDPGQQRIVMLIFILPACVCRARCCVVAAASFAA